MTERAEKNPKIQMILNAEVDEVLGDDKGVSKSLFPPYFHLGYWSSN